MRIFHQTLFFSLICCGFLGTSYAQGVDAVRVLFYGGVESTRVLDFDGTQVLDLGDVSTTSGTLIASLDLKVTGEGVLLAQSNGEGFSIWNDGARTFTLDPSQRYRSVTSASVAGFDSEGAVSRVLFSDSFSNVVLIRELGSNQNSWYRSLTLPSGTFGEVEDAVLLPTGEIVVATNYPSASLSTLDLFGVSGASHRQVANRTHPDGPSELVVAENLADIRDIVGRTDGGLIVGAAGEILSFSPTLELEWRRDLTLLGGELGSLITTPNGYIAFAMFEPGEWVSANTNHRVYWMDAESLEIVGVSGPLERAPAAVDRFSGHGGTGTPGYSAGIELGEGVPEDLLLTGLSASEMVYSRGDLIEIGVNVVNRGSLPVGASSAYLEVGLGNCTEGMAFPQEVTSLGETVFYPGASLRLEGAIEADRLEAGGWCVRGRVVVDETEVVSGAPVRFQILGGGSTNVDVEDLGFSTEPDLGFPDADMSVDVPILADSGCGCEGGAGGALLPIIVLVPGLIRRRRRS